MEYGQQDVVYDLAARPDDVRAVQRVPSEGRAGRVVGSPGDPVHEGERLRPADADDADPAPARRRGEGTDSIARIVSHGHSIPVLKKAARSSIMNAKTCDFFRLRVS